MSNDSISILDHRNDVNPRRNRFKIKTLLKVFQMQSLILMSYKQPNENPEAFRWGVVIGTRDTKKEPLTRETLRGYYRGGDPNFQRSRTITMVKTRDGIKQFYLERTNWKIQIPFVGSIVRRFLPAN